MAAHEGSEHAERAEQRGIGEATLEQFRADVTSLSVQYMTGETFGLFKEMRRVRNRILEALDRRQWPRDAAELYLRAGCLCALIARLRVGALDAAITALEPVLALPPGERTAVEGKRLSVVRAELAHPVYRGSPAARGLDEQLAGFAPGELGSLPDQLRVGRV